MESTHACLMGFCSAMEISAERLATWIVLIITSVPSTSVAREAPKSVASRATYAVKIQITAAAMVKNVAAVDVVQVATTSTAITIIIATVAMCARAISACRMAQRLAARDIAILATIAAVTDVVRVDQPIVTGIRYIATEEILAVEAAVALEDGTATVAVIVCPGRKPCLNTA